MGFRVWGVGFEDWGLACRVQVQGLEIQVWA